MEVEISRTLEITFVVVIQFLKISNLNFRMLLLNLDYESSPFN